MVWKNYLVQHLTGSSTTRGLQRRQKPREDGKSKEQRSEARAQLRNGIRIEKMPDLEKLGCYSKFSGWNERSPVAFIEHFSSVPISLAPCFIDRHACIINLCVGAPHGGFLYLLKIPCETFHDLPPFSFSGVFFFPFQLLKTNVFCHLLLALSACLQPSPSSCSKSAWPRVTLPGCWWQKSPHLPTDHTCSVMCSAVE